MMFVVDKNVRLVEDQLVTQDTATQDMMELSIAVLEILESLQKYVHLMKM